MRSFNLKNEQLASRVFLTSLFVLGFVLVALTAYSARYTLNPDGVSYISIASQYVDGHSSDAINAYWSPLLSWLIAPLIALGFTGQDSFMIVNTLIALGIIFVGVITIWRYSNKNFMATFAFWLSILPFLMFATQTVITPDLLTVLSMGLFILVVFKLEESLRSKELDLKWLILTAAVGAIGYYAKLFFLPFFMAAIITLLITRQSLLVSSEKKWTWIKPERKDLRALLLLILLLFLFIAPWVLAISVKSGHLTLGTSFSYNISNAGQENTKENPKARANPFTRILWPPPNEHAVASNEDPTQLPHASLGPSDGNPGFSLKNYAAWVKNNGHVYIDKVTSLSPLLISTVLATFTVIALGSTRYKKHYPMYISILALIMYAGGYAPVVRVNQRYLWPLLIPIIYIGILLVVRLHQYFESQELRKKWASAILFISLPLASISSFQPNLRVLANKPSEPTLSIYARDILKSGIASEGARIIGNEFAEVTYLAYYLGAQNYGVTNAVDLNDPSTQEFINRHNIDLFIGFYEDIKDVLPEDGYKVLNIYKMSSSACSDSEVRCSMSIVSLNDD